MEKYGCVLISNVNKLERKCACNNEAIVCEIEEREESQR